MFMHHVHEQVHHYDLNENHIQGYVEALEEEKMVNGKYN